ncbi:MAG: hypothetical protein ACKVVT_02345 [Dehalococcoidia bacterium]
MAAGLATLLAACGGGGSSRPPATPSPDKTSTAASSVEATPTTATVTSTATRTAAPDATLLRIGDPVPLPRGLVVVAFDGRWEGPTLALRRYYTSPTGDLITEVLRESELLGNADPAKIRGITSAAMSQDGRHLAVGLCHGYCYADISPVTIAHSFDGGITWSTISTLEPTGWVDAVSTEAVLVGRSNGSAVLEGLLLRGETSTPVDVPSDWRQDWFRAVDTPDGFVIYRRAGAAAVFRHVDGKPYATVKPTGMTGETYVQALAGKGDGLFLFATTHEGEFAGRLTVTEVWNPANERAYRFTKESGIDGFWPAAWLSPTQVLGSGSFQRSRVGAEDPNWTTGLPAIFDLTTGTVSPIVEFMQFAPGKAGGPVPIGVLQGTFVQVTGAGDCLNVRDEPRADAPVSGCYADRVLMESRGETRVDASGRTWWRVAPPGGRAEGWAASDFLELATQAPR